jgi:type I restriction enzyme S subunit
MSEWREITLGDLCDDGDARIQTGPFGSQLHSYDYQATGVPVVPTEAIGHRRIKDESVPRVSEATAARLARHKLKPGDILFARRGCTSNRFLCHR